MCFLLFLSQDSTPAILTAAAVSDERLTTMGRRRTVTQPHSIVSPFPRPRKDAKFTFLRADSSVRIILLKLNYCYCCGSPICLVPRTYFFRFFFFYLITAELWCTSAVTSASHPESESHRTSLHILALFHLDSTILCFAKVLKDQCTNNFSMIFFTDLY